MSRVIITEMARRFFRGLLKTLMTQCFGKSKDSYDFPDDCPTCKDISSNMDTDEELRLHEYTCKHCTKIITQRRKLIARKRLHEAEINRKRKIDERRRQQAPAKPRVTTEKDAGRPVGVAPKAPAHKPNDGGSNVNKPAIPNNRNPNVDETVETLDGDAELVNVVYNKATNRFDVIDSTKPAIMPPGRRNNNSPMTTSKKYNVNTSNDYEYGETNDMNKYSNETTYDDDNDTDERYKYNSNGNFSKGTTQNDKLLDDRSLTRDTNRDYDDATEYANNATTASTITDEDDTTTYLIAAHNKDASKTGKFPKYSRNNKHGINDTGYYRRYATFDDDENIREYDDEYYAAIVDHQPKKKSLKRHIRSMSDYVELNDLITSTDDIVDTLADSIAETIDVDEIYRSTTTISNSSEEKPLFNLIINKIFPLNNDTAANSPTSPIILDSVDGGPEPVDSSSKTVTFTADIHTDQTMTKLAPIITQPATTTKALDELPLITITPPSEPEVVATTTTLTKEDQVAGDKLTLTVPPPPPPATTISTSSTPSSSDQSMVKILPETTSSITTEPAKI